MKRLGVGVAILALAAGLGAQAAVDPVVGDWHGTLDVQGMKLRLVVHVQVGEDGGYSATLDSVDQNAMGIPIDHFERDGDAVEFRVKRLMVRYEGTLIGGDAPRIEGKFLQAGMTLPLELVRGEGAALKRPQEPVGPFPYRAVDVAYSYLPEPGVEESFEPTRVSDEGAVTLAGTLTLPEGDGPHPAALLISGSGPQDRDESLLGHKPFLVLADHLTRNGVAVLRYDDRGVGESTGDMSEATGHDLTQDARAGLRYLRTRADIDHDRVGLIGHSEGGLIAPAISGGPDGEWLDFIVLLAGPGVPGAEIILHQSQLIAKAAGASGPDLEVSGRMQKQLFEALLTIEDAGDRRDRMRAIARDAWGDFSDEAQAEQGNFANLMTSVRRLETPWLRYFAGYDPRPALERTACSVLAMTGEKDLQVDPAQNHGPIRAALEAGGNQDFTVVELPGLNHLFQTCETGAPSEYQQIEETFSPDALKVLTDWLRARL